MIHYQSNRQLSFADFALAFNGTLDGNNRWVKLATLLPWDDLVRVYARDLRDDLTVTPVHQFLNNQVQENPYLQYFLGCEEYRYRVVFDASLLVSIRKRLNRKAVAEVTREVEKFREAFEAKWSLADKDKDKDGARSDSLKSEGCATCGKEAHDRSGSAESDDQRMVHRGQLILDATAAELEIPYPTDLGLLNEARLQSERIIDVLWSIPAIRDGKKPRTYRQKAKSSYMTIARKRKKRRKEIRRGAKQQLQYLRRNIRIINELSRSAVAKLLLTRRDKQLIETIGKVYAQQQQMYDEKVRRIDNRIVNLYQPWVRPIKRGKSGSDVEFGPKLSVSLVGNVVYVDYFSWDAYNEGNSLKQQVEAYYQGYGFYPEAVIADTIYGNRENRQYLKESGIRFSGKQLGRPVQIREDNRGRITAEKRQRKAEQRTRNRIEGCFGVGRRRYGLGRVQTRLQETSETAICMAFFAMTIAAYLAACFVWQMKRWWRLQTYYDAIFRLIQVSFDNNGEKERYRFSAAD